jgi:DNA-binding response OmpR family regulator
MRQVWVVDDDEEMNRAIELMLKTLDCEVLSFFNARSTAQTLLTGKRPDVLILDVDLQEISGLDLLEFLRRRKEWKELPVVMLSSEASDGVKEKAMQTGADAYLVKPVTPEELEATMAAILKKRLKIE